MNPQTAVAPEPALTVGDGVVGMLNAFVDPASTARRVPAPLSWLWPVIVLSAVYLIFGSLMVPYALALANARMVQQNIPPEQMERAMNIAHMVSRITVPATPLFVVGLLAFFAWLIGLVASMLGLRTKFRDLFALIGACALIPALQYIATYIVVRTKGDEITSQEQLTPPFGFDIALQNIHGALFAFVNFFSIFEIWYLIVLTIGLAYLAKTTKGRAFAAITPAWLLPLFLRVIQGMLQGGAGG